MKFSRDQLILTILVLALLAAMLITLFVGGSRSRHGYGLLFPVPHTLSTAIATNGWHLISPPNNTTVAHFNQKSKPVPMLNS